MGFGFVAGDTIGIEPGVMLYVPRGVRHGFISTGDEVEFVWVISPQGLSERFRRTGFRPAPAGPSEQK